MAESSMQIAVATAATVVGVFLRGAEKMMKITGRIYITQ